MFSTTRSVNGTATCGLAKPSLKTLLFTALRAGKRLTIGDIYLSKTVRVETKQSSLRCSGQPVNLIALKWWFKTFF